MNTIPDLEDVKPRQRVLTLDPVVIAAFGDFREALKKQVSCLCKDSGCTSQSTQPNGPGDSKNETSSVNR